MCYRQLLIWYEKLGSESGMEGGAIGKDKLLDWLHRKTLKDYS